MDTSQTTDMALSLLLELQARDGQTVAELTKSMSANRSVIQRLVATLHGRALIIRSQEGRYWLGPGLLALARHLPHELSRLGAGTMRRLADSTGTAVVLAVPEGDQASVVASIDGSNGLLRIEYAKGFRQSLAEGVSGLAMLAFLDDEHPLRRSPEVDAAGLRQIRADGVAKTEGDASALAGIAAPIESSEHGVIGSLAFFAPRSEADRLGTYTGLLQRAAADLGSLYESQIIGA